MVDLIIMDSGNIQGGGDTKLERFLPKKHTVRKLLYFVNRHSAEPSKIGHHLRK